MSHPMNINVNTRMRWAAMSALPCFERPRGKRVLDLAAGLGFFSVKLAGLGADVLAADIHEPSLTYLHQQFGLETLALDLQNGDYPGEGFDIVLLCEVLEHLQDPETVVARAAHCLAPGGTLVLTTPALEGPLIHTPGKELGHDAGAEKHERDGFWREELEDMTRRAGLVPKGHRYCVFYLSELFMQLTKRMYLRKKKRYAGQSDVVSTMNSTSYRTLRRLYPLMHPVFMLEESAGRRFGVRGNCHLLWAEKTS